MAKGLKKSQTSAKKHRGTTTKKGNNTKIATRHAHQPRPQAQNPPKCEDTGPKEPPNLEIDETNVQTLKDTIYALRK